MYVVGFDGDFRSTLLISDDRGQSWSPRPIHPYPELPMYLSAVDPVDPDTLYIRVDGGSSDHLIVSRDCGSELCRHPHDSDRHARLCSVAGRSPSRSRRPGCGFAGGDDDGLRVQPCREHRQPALLDLVRPADSSRAPRRASTTGRWRYRRIRARALPPSGTFRTWFPSSARRPRPPARCAPAPGWTSRRRSALTWCPTGSPTREVLAPRLRARLDGRLLVQRASGPSPRGPVWAWARRYSVWSAPRIAAPASSDAGGLTARSPP